MNRNSLTMCLKLLFLSLILFFLIQLQPISVTAQEGSLLAEPDPRFGAVEAFWAPQEALEAGVGWDRILFYWDHIQPNGKEDWNARHVPDIWLRGALLQKREVMGVLIQTPGWATDGIPDAGVPRGLYLPNDDPNNLWANFVRRTADHYRWRHVHHWVIWNEPEIQADVYGHEFSGSVEDYYQLLKVAYQVIKEVDPEAVIHLAGITFWHDAVAGRPPYLARLLEVAMQDPEAAAHNYFFDVISLHIYFKTETIPMIVGAIQEIQESFGLNKPIWINETNASPNLDPWWPIERLGFKIDLEQQASFIVQAYALGFASGAERIAVYKFTDILLPAGGEPFGLLRADFSPRPAYTAYKTTTNYLRHFIKVEQEQADDFYIIKFTRPNDVVRVMWARTDKNITLNLPADSSSATLANALGETQTIEAQEEHYTITLQGARCDEECIIGGPPLFLIEGLPVTTSLPTIPTIEPTITPSLPQPLSEGLEALESSPTRPFPLSPTSTPPRVTAPYRHAPSITRQGYHPTNWLMGIVLLIAIVIGGWLVSMRDADVYK